MIERDAVATQFLSLQGFRNDLFRKQRILLTFLLCARCTRDFYVHDQRNTKSRSCISTRVVIEMTTWLYQITSTMQSTLQLTVYLGYLMTHLAAHWNAKVWSGKHRTHVLQVANSTGHLSAAFDTNPSVIERSINMPGLSFLCYCFDR